jgi:hypothetical protein
MKKFAVGTALVTVILGSCSSEPYDPNNPVEAEAQCEGFAGKRLKAPSTADFDLSASREGPGWVVTGTVDAENSFGASLRSDIMCRLHFEGDTAYLDDISIN